MGDTAPAAQLAHYNKTVQTCRTREGPAAAAGLRCVSFIDDHYTSAGLLARVLPLCLKHSPACIEHGFGHPGLDQFQAAHLADDYPLIFSDYSLGVLVRGILATP